MNCEDSANPVARGSRPSRVVDLELAERAAAGDPAGQRCLVERLMPRVKRLCKALLRNRDDADDATQLSLLELLRSAGGFRGDSSLECWADRIVVRTTLRHANRRRRLALAPLDAQPMLSVHALGDPTVAAGEYLSLLSEGQRVAVVLRCGFEYSVDEIAELTKTSPNTIKDRLKVARERVRRVTRLNEVEPRPRAAGVRR